MADPDRADRAPKTEEEIRAAWVEEPPRLTGKIQVVDYDPRWPGLFRRESERIRAVLGEPAAQRPSRSAHYQRVKRELAQRDWTYVQQYADAKTEVVEEIIVRARAGGG
jgi:GrpB-like predicted nucleotidyltransferase (UPF0157 family)